MVDFSIIVPVYNVKPYLEECLDSILCQKVRSWECICVDDGSSDGSGKILDKYADNDSRFKVYHTANNGVSAARNVGLEKASGEWTCFLDGDDIIAPYTLELYSYLIKGRPSADMIGAKGAIFHDGEKIQWHSININELSIRSVSLKNEISNDIVQRGFVAYVYSRKLIDKVRFKAYAHGEDRLFLVSCLSCATDLAQCDVVVYGYRRRKGSATTIESPGAIRDEIAVIRQIFSVVNDNGKRCDKALVRLYLNSFMESVPYRILSLSCGPTEELWRLWFDGVCHISKNARCGLFQRIRMWVCCLCRIKPLICLFCILPYQIKRLGVHR